MQRRHVRHDVGVTREHILQVLRIVPYAPTKKKKRHPRAMSQKHSAKPKQRYMLRIHQRIAAHALNAWVNDDRASNSQNFFFGWRGVTTVTKLRLSTRFFRVSLRTILIFRNTWKKNFVRHSRRGLSLFLQKMGRQMKQKAHVHTKVKSLR